MPWIPAQRDTEELLDLGAGTPEQRQASLRDLRRLNRWFGGVSTSWRELARLLHRLEGKELTLLDLGTGSADVPAALRRLAARHGVRLRAIGLDCKPEHLRAAREVLRREPAPCS